MKNAFCNRHRTSGRWRDTNRMESVFILLIIVVIVVTTVVRAFFTARLLVAFFATSLLAIRTTLLAVAVTPNRVSHHAQNLDGVVGVVAVMTS